MYLRMEGPTEEMLLVMERVNSVENYLGQERGGIRLNLGRGEEDAEFRIYEGDANLRQEPGQI